MAAILVCSALAKAVAYSGLPSTTSLLLCALLTSVGLAAYFVGGTTGQREPAEDSTVPEGVGAHVLSEEASDFERRCARLAERAGLTEREGEMLLMLARGHSLKRASEVLSVSEGTAKYYRHNLYVKVGVSSRRELIDAIAGEALC